MERAPTWMWLFGPCGAGKTATAYRLFETLAADGRRVGYVEIDQLGMCLPVDDHASDDLKVTNLVSVLRNFADQSVDAVIVSGDIAGAPMAEALRRTAASKPVLVRLRVGFDTAEARLRARGAPREYAEHTRTYDERFPFAGDFSIDTTERTVDQVVTAIRERLQDWPPHASRPPVSSPRGAAPPSGSALSSPRVAAAPRDSAVLVCGPRCVGKSAVGWGVFMASVSSGVTTAFLDLAQIGFVRGSSGSSLTAANLAALWRNFSEFGARRLVLNGDVDAHQLAAYRAVLPIVVCGLTASSEHLAHRALLRSRGHGVELPGDDLRGRVSVDVDTRRRLGASFVDVEIDTSELTVEEIAHSLMARLAPPI